MDIPISQLNRIWEAMLDGWAFTGWDRSKDKRYTHFVLAWSPLYLSWIEIRAPGDREDWVEALLNEAGVPEYSVENVNRLLDTDT